MSGRLYSSPALQLRIGKSRLRAALYGALCVITCYALWAIAARGFAMVAMILLPMAIGCLWRLRRDPAADTQLCWRAGEWTLEQHGQRRYITPGSRCIVTPWVIHLAYTELSARSARSLWVYVDSVPDEQMRQLRVRLTLLH